MPLGFEVVTRESAQSGGLSTGTGTAFVAAEASFGPETPILVKSLAEAITVFGPRSETASLKLYDWLNSFFATGGARAYVNRALGAGIKFAEVAVATAGKPKGLLITARYKGTYGNKIQITVLAESIVVTSEITGEVLETIKIGAKLESATYPKETPYVIITEGSDYATAKSEAMKTATIASLTGGVNPTVTKVTLQTAIEGFAKNFGPGQLAAVATTFATEESVHKSMGEHCVANNRLALCDLKEAEKAATTVATLTGEKGSYATAIQSYMMFFSSACSVQGVTLGTTRTVPASAIVAGLCAQVARTNNDNQAPAGEQWTVAPYVLSFTNNYKQSEMETLKNAGITSFTELNGTPCLFGFWSAISEETNSIFWQATAGRERMHLVWQGEQILGKYLFATLDGRHHLEAALQGALQGMVKEHWENNALYGERPNEAGTVNVQEPINTNTTRSKGELNAELKVRISPFANYVKLVIVPTPITESLAQAA